MFLLASHPTKALERNSLLHLHLVICNLVPRGFAYLWQGSQTWVEVKLLEDPIASFSGRSIRCNLPPSTTVSCRIKWRNMPGIGRMIPSMTGFPEGRHVWAYTTKSI
ncbi:hypothetical protein C8J56DRAFT_978280 [Mycena floridula]|nr:hypothetical protein C8J56DRAFT_978280 [Mycena floridula]